MQLNRIKKRGFLFTYHQPGWNLNIYLIIGKKYNYIIDTGLGSFCVAPILDCIKETAKQTIVVNTHHHWDHIWGNSFFKDSVIVSHKLCPDLIQANWDDMLHKNIRHCYGDVSMYLPNLLFEEELYFSEDKIRLFYSPGHTMDSISILDEKEKVRFWVITLVIVWRNFFQVFNAIQRFIEIL
jgi:glyoxylase-like metal-dependent hydrolase (beta-lactamase superfamily II)